MATSGPRRGSAADPGDRSTQTRAALITGAIEALREVGFAGASAREIARRAGCAQALVFYHFGSVADLLLAALDEVSQSRLARYSPLVGSASSLTGLIDSARTIFGEDLDAGHVTVLVEMIAGARAVPGLGEQVAHRLEPWREFAATAVRSVTDRSPMAALLPADEIAHALVAGLLGLELLANLDGDRAAAPAMFDRARAVAALLDATASAGRAPGTDPVRAPQ